MNETKRSPSQEAFLGSLAADALAMPVHWYYDTAGLQRDYGTVDRFLELKNPHPGSILWRSEYRALNEKGEILREQAQYWGQRGIHYHQFLKAGRIRSISKSRGSFLPSCGSEAPTMPMLGWSATLPGCLSLDGTATPT